MRPCLRGAWAAALVVLAVSAVPASAAWDNVFQVCCTSCRPNVSAYVAPVPAPAPACQPACQTYYEERYYYQPVTTYKTSYYYEPVTTYKTSYYYEPVTTVRYSTYYDPCSGCPQQVATQQTCMQLKSQTCPVTSYLQRTCVQPVVTPAADVLLCAEDDLLQHDGRGSDLRRSGDGSCRSAARSWGRRQRRPRAGGSG